ncbi:hypothetical protein D3C80_1782220 [compost metagenome]
MVDEQLPVETRRRHGTGHVVFRTERVGRTAPLGGLGQIGSAEQRGADSKAEQVRKGRIHRVNLCCCYRSGACRHPALARDRAKIGQMRLNKAERWLSVVPSAAL